MFIDVIKNILGPRGVAGYINTNIRVLRFKMLPKIGKSKTREQETARTDDCGIFFIAFGDKYVNEAIHAAKSIKQRSNIKTAICCDKISQAGKDFFDDVQIIKPEHIRAKVDFLDQTPFENTLYLDSDTEIAEDISYIFGILDKYDLAMAHDFARKRARWSKEIPEYAAIPEGFSEFGGGVILYNKTRARDFIEKWRHYFYRNFHKTNGWDQASLRIAAWESLCSIYVLPTEYNVRSEAVRKKTDTLPEKEGGAHPLRPRILHWHGLNIPDNNATPYKF